MIEVNRLSVWADCSRARCRQKATRRLVVLGAGQIVVVRHLAKMSRAVPGRHAVPIGLQPLSRLEPLPVDRSPDPQIDMVRTRSEQFPFSLPQTSEIENRSNHSRTRPCSNVYCGNRFRQHQSPQR